MTVALFVFGFIWLFALTVLVGGLVRHVATVVVAGSAVATNGGGTGFNFDTDGPWIPSGLPNRVVEIFERSSIQTKDLICAFFSASCKTCLERAEDMERMGIDAHRTVILLTGSYPEGLASLGDAFRDAGAVMLFDPDAHDVVKSLDINSTPFAFRVVDSEIVAKTYIRTADDFRRLAADELTRSRVSETDGKHDALAERAVLT
jgi:hypothetical protein